MTTPKIGTDNQNRRIDLHAAPDAERYVIGAILRDPSCLMTVKLLLSGPKDFSDRVHAQMYGAITEIDNGRGSIDITSVAEQLRSTPNANITSPMADLVAILEEVHSIALLDQHARLVREKARVRSLLYTAQRVLLEGERRDIVADDLIRTLQTDIEAATAYDREVVFNLGTVVQRMAAQALGDIPLIYKKDIVETRIADLNSFLGGGLFKGDMIVIGGPPSMGKSSFGLDLCHFNATIGRHSLYFALDETLTALAHRIMLLESRVSRDRLIGGTLTINEKQSLRVASTAIASQRGTIEICDKTSLSVAELRTIARAIHCKNQLDIIVVDHLGLLAPPPGMRLDNRVALVSENSRALKALAKELNVVLILVSQLNREYASKALKPDRGKLGLPTQAMLRDSGQVEADANVIIFPWRPLEAMRKRGMTDSTPDFQRERAKNVPPVEDAIMVVAKNKMGPTGNVPAKFNGERMWFYSQTQRKPQSMEPIVRDQPTLELFDGKPTN